MHLETHTHTNLYMYNVCMLMSSLRVRLLQEMLTGRVIFSSINLNSPYLTTLLYLVRELNNNVLKYIYICIYNNTVHLCMLRMMHKWCVNSMPYVVVLLVVVLRLTSQMTKDVTLEVRKNCQRHMERKY